MKKTPLLYILLLSVFLITCQEDPKCRVGRVYLTQELKDYCDFPVGSYWIYKDSISAAIDSVYLYHKTRTCIKGDYCEDCPPYAGDGGFVLINEKFHDYFISSFYADTIVRNGASGNELAPFPEYGYKWGGFPFRKGVVPDKNIKLKVGVALQGVYLDKYDSLAINNQIYDSVRVFLDYASVYDSNDSINVFRHFVHYISKNTGIIKYHLQGSNYFGSNTYVWELVRYHINK